MLRELKPTNKHRTIFPGFSLLVYYLLISDNFIRSGVLKGKQGAPIVPIHVTPISPVPPTKKEIGVLAGYSKGCIDKPAGSHNKRSVTASNRSVDNEYSKYVGKIMSMYPEEFKNFNLNSIVQEGIALVPVEASNNNLIGDFLRDKYNLGELSKSNKCLCGISGDVLAPDFHAKMLAPGNWCDFV